MLAALHLRVSCLPQAAGSAPCSLEGFGRIDADRFDHLHVQAPINVRADAGGREFLASVLERRASEQILPAEPRSEPVIGSGGVLRDLMSLAKLAGEEAYLDGAEAISTTHVRRAADRFGRSLLIGLQPNELDKLKQVHESRRFVQVSPSDVALVATRRILAYDEYSGTYAVHPAIDPLIVDIGVASKHFCGGMSSRQFPLGNGPRFIRFDLDQRHEKDGLRSHVHPGLADSRLPSPILDPIEALHFLLVHLRKP